MSKFAVRVKTDKFLLNEFVKSYGHKLGKGSTNTLLLKHLSGLKIV